MVNNNLIDNRPKVTTKVTESWKTPKRRYEMKPRKKKQEKSRKEEIYLKQEKKKITGQPQEEERQYMRV